ncbi:MAG: hypothetical protein ABSG51_09220 [Terracidiphilus sp.]
MKLHRIMDPKSIDERLLGQALADGTSVVVLQFSRESAYSTSILEEVNGACRAFGSKVNVRFYAHYGSRFDCAHLRYLPEVRSLNLDCLDGISNTCELAHLPHLEEFAFGVDNSDLPELLRTQSLMNLRKLIVGPSRKSNIDLSPLADCQHLEDLSLCAQARGIESIAHLDTVKKLFFSGMGKRQLLNFIRTMMGLVSLTMMLGGRQDLKDLAHPGIVYLEVIRVRGLSEIDLGLFPNVEKLRIEDQLQISVLNMLNGPHLRWLSIANCKALRHLQGIGFAERLESLLLSRTAIEPQSLLTDLPKCLKRLSLTGYGNRRDDELQSKIESLGYAPAKYMQDDYAL